MLATALLVVAGFAGRAQTPRHPISCTLSNGDRLNGDMVSISRDRIRIAHRSLGMLVLKRGAIAICESSDSTARHLLGALALEPLAELPAATVVALPDFVSTPVILRAQAVTLEHLLHPTHPALQAARALPTYVSHVGWKRSLGSTYMLTRGNANVSNLGFTGSVARRADRSQVALHAKREFGSKDGTATENYMSATLRYDLALGANDSAAAARPSFFTEAVYEHDPFAKIGRRAVENTGLSVPLSRNPRDKLALEIGTGITNEAPTGQGSYTRIGGLLRLAARQLFGSATSDQQLAVFPDLSGSPGHYRLNGDVNLVAPIARAVALKLGIANRYDTRPQANVRKYDTTVQSGVAVEF